VKSRLNRLALSSVSFLLMGLPHAALAHPGHGVPDLSQGFAHPLSGLDHLLAMLAVGLWAAQLGGQARWIAPSAFVTTMVVGGLLGMQGTPVPWVEQGIVASVFVLGLMIALATKPPLALTVAIVAVFALFHGHAHGAEMPTGGAWLGYAVGFTTATVLLHAAGIGIAQALTLKAATKPWLRYAGGGIALTGLVLGLR
jgi:urease accessory protein